MSDRLITDIHQIDDPIMDQLDVKHFWLGHPDPRLGETLKDKVLCWKMADRVLDPRSHGAIGITVVKGDVNCQECLEWLHA